jgi:hypothetical protein
MYPRPDRVHPVLAGVDGRLGTANVLRVAACVAGRAGVQLVVAHIVQPRYSAVSEMASCYSNNTETETLARLLPEIWIELAELSAPWTIVSSIGAPAAELVRFARTLHPCAVIVGAETPGMLARFRRGVNGSVSTALSRHQGAPVITVPVGRAHRFDYNDPATFEN